MGRTPAKRVNIVRIQMVKEASLLYPARRVRMARDVVELFREFLQETDREQFFMLGRPD
jgi:DNA repair protein RadC